MPQRAIVIVSLLLTSCVAAPAYRPPPSPSPDHHTAAKLPEGAGVAPVNAGPAGATERFAVGTDPVDAWWNEFRVPAIDVLVKQSLGANPSLQAAREVLANARELAHAGRGALLPAVDASDQSGRARSDDAATGAAATRTLYDTFNARLAARYSLDVCGRQRQLGHASMLELLGQRAELDQTRATLLALRNEREVARAAIAVLVGSPRSAFVPPGVVLDEFVLPGELPVSLPSQLLAARPDVRADVRAAEALVPAGSADVGVATADLLAQFTITAGLGSQTNVAGDLLRGPFGVWDFGSRIL